MTTSYNPYFMTEKQTLNAFILIIRYKYHNIQISYNV